MLMNGRFLKSALQPVTALALAGFWLIGSCLVAFPSAAAEGVLSSVVFGKVPAKSAMVVEAFDDSEDSESLRQEFASAIATAGFAESSDAPLLLIFEVRDELGAFSTRERRHILSLETKGGRLGGGQDSQAKVNVFNSNSGGLLNKGRGTTTIVTPSSYRIDVSIENRSTGKTLWQGWAVAETQRSLGRDMTRRMVPRLVEAIGKTVREKRFSLLE